MGKLLKDRVLIADRRSKVWESSLYGGKMLGQCWDGKPNIRYRVSVARCPSEIESRRDSWSDIGPP